MMLLLPLLSAALASPRYAATLPLGGDVVDLAVDAEGRWLAARVDSSTVYITDTWTWQPMAITICASGSFADGGRSGGLAFTSDLDLLVGCDDGTIAIVRGADAGWSDSGETYAPGAGAVRGLGASGDELVVIADPADGDGNPVALTLSLASGTLTSAEAGSTLGDASFQDLEMGSGVAVVAQGAARVSKVDAGTGAVTATSSSVSGATVDDLTPASGSDFYAAGGDAGLLRVKTGNNDISTQVNIRDLGLEVGVAAVGAVSYADGELILVDEVGQQIYGFPATESTVTPPAAWSLDFPDAGDSTTVTELAAVDGYTLAGSRGAATETGLWVYTDRPWVTAIDPIPATAAKGDTVAVSFTADIGGAWSLRRGATTDTDGHVLAEGTLSAGETVDTSFEVGGGFGEGGNLLRVVVDAGNGLVGHDAVSLLIDNPPPQPSFSLGFGDEALKVSIPDSEAADVATFEIYITTVAFEADDYETCVPGDDASPCGPAYVGPDEGIESPIVLTVVEDEKSVQRIEGLTNNQKYYVAVRAIDAGGQEGAMSKVKVGKPRETYSVSELVGEEGGYCGTPAPLSALLAGAGGLLVASRRRRAAAALPFLALGLFALSPAAQAGDGSETAEHGAVQLRLGRLDLSDPTMEATLGAADKKVLWFEIAPHIPEVGRYVEASAGFGLYRNHGFQFDSEFAPSFEPDKVGCFPLTLGLTGRLDVLRNQPVVPVVGVGADYWLFNERWSKEVGGELNQSVAGAKYGWHYLVGGQLLLDVIEPARASVLAARSGIDNSYLAVEYRKQTIGEAQAEADGGGFVFSGDALTIGLKFDY